MPEGALEGLKVLDFSHYISGPYCTKMLGALGAEVIKVEKPGEGDGARKVGLFFEDEPNTEKSALFLYLNTNKKSITLNLKTIMGLKLAKELVKDADVLVENFEPRVMPSLGLDYKTLAEINPRLVMTSISAFGQTGPYRDYKGNSLIGYAMGGYMYITGDPDREPLQSGGMQPEYQGGLHAFTGTMAALYSRELTGHGQHVDISIMECMAALHQFTIVRYTYAGRIQKRVGNRSPWSHPIGIYPCKDGDVAISAAADDQAERLLLMMEMENLLQDPRFQSGAQRWAHFKEFDESILPWFRQRTKREIIEACQEWRIPSGYVNDVEELLQDPHYRARGFWVDIDHTAAGRLLYAGAPFKMSETPFKFQHAPLLGEHNEEIYHKRLGQSKDDLVRLKQYAII